MCIGFKFLSLLQNYVFIKGCVCNIVAFTCNHQQVSAGS